MIEPSNNILNLRKKNWKYELILWKEMNPVKIAYTNYKIPRKEEAAQEVKIK